MLLQNENLLLIFAKYPQAGLVKTRLGSAIGFEPAARLYWAFLKDLVVRLSVQPTYDLRWVYYPIESRFPELISSMHANNGALGQTSFVAYGETGLLQQQIDQFTWGYQHGYRKVVGIATDTPHLPQEYVTKAFDLLTEFDVILGPTDDGGYYLLGSHPYILIQKDIEMSTGYVTKEILTVANTLKLRTYLLPPMIDIDEEQDLAALTRFLSQAGSNSCPTTWKVIQELLGDGLEPSCKEIGHE